MSPRHCWTRARPGSRPGKCRRCRPEGAGSRKKTAPKAKMVIDNDNLDTLKGPSASSGRNLPLPDDKAQPTRRRRQAGKRLRSRMKPTGAQKFADANKKLADDAHELDIVQREYNLKQEQYYSDPNSGAEARIQPPGFERHEAKIDDKTATVAQDKTGHFGPRRRVAPGRRRSRMGHAAIDADRRRNPHPASAPSASAPATSTSQ